MSVDGVLKTLDDTVYKIIKENKMKLRSYQEVAVEGVIQGFQQNRNKQVLGFATGAGKTVTLYHLVQQYLQNYPKSRVLIMTHGQKVLRQNMINQATAGIKPFEIKKKYQIPYSTGERVVVAIPHTLVGEFSNLGKFDLVVYDEAHQWYNTPVNKELFSTVQAKHTLLATATHGKFSEPEWEKHLYTAFEAFEDGWLADCIFQQMPTNWNFNERDYNKNGELQRTFKICNKTTKPALEDLANKLTSHQLFTPSICDKFDMYKVSAKVKSLFGEAKLVKTMICVRNIEMADFVYQFMKSKFGEQVVMSQSINDEPSAEMEDFKTNDKKILIVVGRGSLGWDFSELQVIVDMTCSKNIDSFIQKKGRVMRKSKQDESKPKTYIRFSAQGMIEYDLILATTGLFLSHPINNRKYSGSYKNVPIVRPVKKISKTGTKTKRRNNNVQEELVLEPIMLDFRWATGIFKQVIDGTVGTHLRVTTMSEFIKECRGIYPDPTSKDELLEFFKKHNITSAKDFQKRFGRIKTKSNKLGIYKPAAEVMGWKTRQDKDFTKKTVEQFISEINYAGIVTVDELRKNIALYGQICRSGLMKQVYDRLGWKKQMQSGRKLTLEFIIQLIKDNQWNKTEWYKNDKISYGAASANKWIDKIYAEMGWERGINSNAVNEFDADGNFVRRWGSAQEIAKANKGKRGWSVNNIRHVIRGRKSDIEGRVFKYLSN